MATEEKRILVRRDTATNWSTANPVLASGEWGYDQSNRVYKMGNGVTAWNSLQVSSGLATTNPAALGTASPGVSQAGARGDHVHPTGGLVVEGDSRLSNSRTPTAHNHAASEVTSGIFPVARGGTGRSSLTAGRYLQGDGTNIVISRTNAEVRDDLGVPLTADVIARNAGATVVDHGGNAAVTRPTGALMVIWRGTVLPTNAAAGDFYIDLT